MQIIFRKEAKAQNLKFYFTGKECKHGHVTKRYVSTGQCVDCCKICDKNNTTYKRDYHKKNKTQLNAKNKEWRKSNKAHVKAYNDKYRKEHPDKVKKWSKEYADRNPHVAKIKKIKYRSKRKQATPPWYEKDLIRQVYTMRDKLSKLWGIDLHVDHIVPLQGKNVCGLHCWDNLQLLEATINVSKSNK